MSVRITRAAAAAAQIHLEDETVQRDLEAPTNPLALSTNSTKHGRKRGKKSTAEDIIFDDAAGVALPDSSIVESPGKDVLAQSMNGHSRAPSGSKQPILIAMDNDTEPEARPGSPTVDFRKSVLKPKSQAKQLIAKEKSGMRASSNKENMAPGSPAHGVVASPRVPAIAPPAASATNDAPIAEYLTQSPSDGAPQSAATPHHAPKIGAGETKQVSAKALPSKTAVKPARHSVAASKNPRPSTAAPNTELTIPHSKPRPMSMTFPTPLPPAKSTKAPTRPTFQLPGEAVAAKLKAAKEARALSASTTTRPTAAKASVEQAKKPAFKARSAPKMTSKPDLVRQTAASRARESLMHGAELSGLKRASSVRTSSIRTQHVANTSAHRASVAATTASAPKARPQPSSVDKNITTARRTTSSARPSLASSVATTADGKLKTDKGKAVYGRLAASRDEAERKKREKEEAARKAREMAAEWGRKASQAWAEKKRQAKSASSAQSGAAAVKTTGAANPAATVTKEV